jgi:hypothetical protein
VSRVAESTRLLQPVDTVDADKPPLIVPRCVSLVATFVHGVRRSCGAVFGARVAGNRGQDCYLIGPGDFIEDRGNFQGNRKANAPPSKKRYVGGVPKIVVRVGFVMGILAGTLVGGGATAKVSVKASISNRVNSSPKSGAVIKLWDSTVSSYLKKPLWLADQNYDAGHALMIPLQAAFQPGRDAWLGEFETFFELLEREPGILVSSAKPSQWLGRLHLLYLSAEFLRLCEETKYCKLDHSNLKLLLRLDISKFATQTMFDWYENYDQNGVYKHIEWKIKEYQRNKDIFKSLGKLYYLGVSDFDFFTLAIAADVGNYREKERALALAKIIFEVYGSTQPFFSFQPGVWAQHPDYVFAGNKTLGENLKQSPIESLAEDSSHSHRLALFLNTFVKQSEDAELRRFFESRLIALTELFEKKLFSNEDSCLPKITNFMDGRNGVYRYGHVTQGTHRGFGPWGLSGILMQGWWGALPSQKVKTALLDFARCFPLSNQTIAFYVGPNTTRRRDPLVSEPNYFKNGFAQLNVTLAGSFFAQ